MQVQPLNDEYDRKNFDCGEPALNNWLKQMARQHKVKGVSSTFVTLDHAESVEILGFYSISLAEMLNTQLPAQCAMRLSSRVSASWSSCIFDAIDRVKRISGEVGGTGLVANAKPTALAFFQAYGFEHRWSILFISCCPGRAPSGPLDRWRTNP